MRHAIPLLLLGACAPEEKEENLTCEQQMEKQTPDLKPGLNVRTYNEGAGVAAVEIRHDGKRYDLICAEDYDVYGHCAWWWAADALPSGDYDDYEMWVTVDDVETQVATGSFSYVAPSDMEQCEYIELSPKVQP